jgi:hypothetical protein
MFERAPRLLTMAKFVTTTPWPSSSLASGLYADGHGPTIGRLSRYAQYSMAVAHDVLGLSMRKFQRVQVATCCLTAPAIWEPFGRVWWKTVIVQKRCEPVKTTL